MFLFLKLLLLFILDGVSCRDEGWDTFRQQAIQRAPGTKFYMVDIPEKFKTVRNEYVPCDDFGHMYSFEPGGRGGLWHFIMMFVFIIIRP